MGMIKITDILCIMEIPALTKKGDEWTLHGSDFSEGSMGRVEEVLGRTGGKTRVRMIVLKGSVLYQNTAEDQMVLERSEGADGYRQLARDAMAVRSEMAREAPPQSSGSSSAPATGAAVLQNLGMLDQQGNVVPDGSRRSMGVMSKSQYNKGRQ